jgi:hypothetical protein
MNDKAGIMDQEEGKKLLEEELKDCIDAEYVFSKITNMSNEEITIPVILIKEHLKNKDKYVDITMNSKWSAANWNLNEREAWMILNIEFKSLGVIKFKFNLLDANIRRWIKTLILARGRAVLCDRNKRTNFDIVLSNIPLDIPLEQMTLTAFSMALKKCAVSCG